MFKLGLILLLGASSMFGFSALADAESQVKNHGADQKAPPILRRIDDRQFGISIFTPKEEGVQAAAYVNANELPQVIELLLQDPKSEVSKIKKEIEEKTCPGVPPQNISDECGHVEFTVAVQTAFGRGGWMDGGAAWTLFVGFRDNGTGRFYEAQYGVVINEDVVARVDQEGEYSGELVKTYTFIRVFKYDPRQQKTPAAPIKSFFF